MCSVSQVLSHSANGRDGHSGEIKLHLIYVAPAPGFAGFDGTHNGMFSGVKMLGGMFILGRIAAADLAANHAEPQVDPVVANFQTLFTPARVRFYILNLIHVCAFWHFAPPSVARKQF